MAFHYCPASIQIQASLRNTELFSLLVGLVEQGLVQNKGSEYEGRSGKVCMLHRTVPMYIGDQGLTDGTAHGHCNRHLE
jgi:hypothetical protein